MTGQPLLLRLGFGLRGPRVRVRGMDVAGVVLQIRAGCSCPVWQRGCVDAGGNALA